MEPYAPPPIPASASPEIRRFLEEEFARIAYFINNLETGGSGVEELSDLTDVNTSTPTNRNALIADGVDFESRAIVEADISDLGSYGTLSNVVEDTTPQLGGDLDAQDKDITGVADLQLQNVGATRTATFGIGGTSTNEFHFDFNNTFSTVEFVNVSNRYNFDAECAMPNLGIGTWDLLEISGDLQITKVGSGGQEARIVDTAGYATSYLLMANSARYGRDCDIRDGNNLLVRDTTDADLADFSHDGLDFNTDFTGTTDWNIDSLTGHIRVDGDAVPVSSETTGGSGSAGAGNQYVEIEIAGTIYKVLHDGTV